jgi:hypothetical protein
MIQNKEEFWITNITNRNVCLADLAYTVPKRKSVNLLSNHFHFTLEQLQTSVASGSLFNKKHLIKVRHLRPEKPWERKLELSKDFRQIPARSLVAVDQPKFDELEFKLSDEKFAEEFLKAQDELEAEQRAEEEAKGKK